MDKKHFWYIFYVCTSTSLLTFCICLLIYSLEGRREGPNVSSRNIVRASYPNYDGENPRFVRKIFEEYAAPRTEYKPFIGYRRAQFDGEAVNIDEAGFRISINHKLNNSTWFFGGSTMWGTGSDDKRTIPSLFASATGAAVLNVGESGHSSIQSLIQLQLMLSRGLSPSMVFFYDGVNDGYHFCQGNGETLIRHSYSSRWAKLDRDLQRARQQLKDKPILDLARLGDILTEIYTAPSRLLQQILATDVARNVPLANKVRAKGVYLKCDNQDTANRAAKVTLSSWRSANAILRQEGIGLFYVLQPSASYRSHNYRLDHLIQSERQTILAEEASYVAYYESLKKQFFQTCGDYDDCQNFVDLTEIFHKHSSSFIFLDKSHVSPNGNQLVASALVTALEDR